MAGNILWCALTETRRKRAASVVTFTLTLLVALALFLALLAARYLAVPEFASFARYFSALLFAVFAADAVTLFAIALFYAGTRRREVGIYRMHGARIADILLLNALQLLIPSFSGSLCGVLAGLLAAAVGPLGIPSFLGAGNALALAGTGGQVAFGIPLIEIVVASAVIVPLRKEENSGLSGVSR
jgi:hypothetical protein